MIGRPRMAQQQPFIPLCTAHLHSVKMQVKHAIAATAVRTKHPKRNGSELYMRYSAPAIAPGRCIVKEQNGMQQRTSSSLAGQKLYNTMVLLLRVFPIQGWGVWRVGYPSPQLGSTNCLQGGRLVLDRGKLCAMCEASEFGEEQCEAQYKR